MRRTRWGENLSWAVRALCCVLIAANWISPKNFNLNSKINFQPAQASFSGSQSESERVKTIKRRTLLQRVWFEPIFNLFWDRIPERFALRGFLANEFGSIEIYDPIQKLDENDASCLHLSWFVRNKRLRCFDLKFLLPVYWWLQWFLSAFASHNILHTFKVT